MNESLVKKYLLNKHAALLLISFLLLICSLMPVVRVGVEEEFHDEEYTLHMDLSAIRAIQFFFDSSKELSYDELLDSALYEYYENLENDLNEDMRDLESYEGLTPSMIRRGERLLVVQIRLNLQNELGEVPGYIMVAMVVAVLLMVSAIVLFIISLVNYLHAISGRMPSTAGAFAFLSLVPACVVAFYFALLPYTSESAFGMFSVDENGMFVTACLMILLPFVYGIGILATRLIQYSDQFGRVASSIVKNAVSAVCALVTLLIIFAPVMSTTITAEFGSESRKRDAKTTIDAQYFTYIDLEEDDSLLQSNTKSDCVRLFYQFERYTKREIQRGDADGFNYQFITSIMVTSGIDGTYVPLFSATYYVLMIVGFAAGLIATQNILYICCGRKSVALVRVCKVICVLLSIVALAAIFVYVFAVKFATVELDLNRGYAVSVAIGPILMLVFSIVTACIPARDKRMHMDYQAMVAGMQAQNSTTNASLTQ